MQSMSPRAVLVSVMCVGALAGVSTAGPLTPPSGPVDQTYKTLQQVEPRTTVSAENTPGDADSIFRISQPGSYYLTANITGVAGKHAIEIEAEGVTLDLNGFRLLGVAGSLSGVRVTSAGAGYIIRNGHVREFGQDGIDAAALLGQRGGLVEGIVATDNGRFGVAAASGSVVRNCVAQDNGGSGFRTYIACVIESCSALGNGGSGIEASESAVVRGCTARGNASNGIYASLNSLVERCSSVFNDGSGIFVSGGSTVLECASHRNDGAGVYTGSGNVRIERNNVTENTTGIQVAGTVNWIIGNSARANTSVNYSIVAGNRVGTIVTPPLAGAISGSSGGGSGTTDPWSNIAY
jgi:hypothetical protein